MRGEIVSIGVEVEGGIWRNDFRKLQNKFPTAEIGDDGSVNVNNDHVPYSTRMRRRKKRDFWIDSAEIKYHTINMKELNRFIKMLFKKGFKQNSTCGNHIHIRFKDMDRAVAMFSFKDVFDTFVLKYIKHANGRAKYITRLKNRYCDSGYQDYTMTDQIMSRAKTSSRYKAINLNSANLYKTIEFRVLPYADNYYEYWANMKWLVRTVTRLLKMKFVYSVSPYIPKIDWINGQSYIQLQNEHMFRLSRRLRNAINQIEQAQLEGELHV